MQRLCIPVMTGTLHSQTLRKDCCSSFILLYNLTATREESIMKTCLPSPLSKLNKEPISLRSSPAVNSLPSAWRMTALTFSCWLILVNKSASSVKKGKFMALSDLARERLTRIILPSSSSSTLRVVQANDIKLNNIQMKKALQVIPNKVDKSILLTSDKPFFSLIWLHGLGDSSAGFLDYYQMKSSPVNRGGRVKLLQAPLRKVTCNGGDKYNSWYDIRHFSGGKEEQQFSIPEVKDSMTIIDQKVQEEVTFWKENGLKESDEEIYKRIFIGGFSQGCAMSLCYGLNSDKLLGGVVGFSGHMFQSFQMKNKTKIPMLVYHGDEDTVLQYAWAKVGYDKHLQKLPNFTFKLIEGLPHSVIERQLAESTQWILQNLQKNGIKP